MNYIALVGSALLTVIVLLTMNGYYRLLSKKIDKISHVSQNRPEDAKLEAVNFEDGRLNVLYSHPHFAILIQDIIGLYKQVCGVNYIGLKVKDNNTGEDYEVVVQRVEGLTPVEKAAKLTLELQTEKTHSLDVFNDLVNTKRSLSLLLSASQELIAFIDTRRIEPLSLEERSLTEFAQMVKSLEERAK